MNKTTFVKTTALALSMMASASVLAEDTGTAASGSDSGSMPMMHPMQGGMPMMQSQQGGMPMMQHQPGGMPMMGGPGSMMNPQMMQQMMTMKQQHMQTMETHLANIEALLKELVELQKTKQ